MRNASTAQIIANSSYFIRSAYLLWLYHLVLRTPKRRSLSDELVSNDEHIDEAEFRDRSIHLLETLVQKQADEVPNWLKTRVQAEMKELRKLFDRVVLTTRRVKRIVNDLELLKAGRIPNGEKQFTMNYTIAENADPLSASDVTFTTTVPAGTSYEDAKNAPC